MKPWQSTASGFFYQYNYPNYGDWWWNFRVNYFGPSGYVDGSIYDYPTFGSYVNAVYLNGANFMEALRTRVGDDVYFAFLKITPRVMLTGMSLPPILCHTAPAHRHKFF